MERIKALKEFHNIYDEYFCGKTFEYLTHNNSVVKIIFRKQNFAHLTGFVFHDKNSRKLSAKEVYNLLEKSRISLNNIREKEDGTTRQKVQVYFDLHRLATLDTKIVILDNGFVEIKTAVASKKKTVALVVENNMPKSFLNQRGNFKEVTVERIKEIKVYENQTGNLINHLK